MSFVEMKTIITQYEKDSLREEIDAFTLRIIDHIYFIIMCVIFLIGNGKRKIT